MVAAIVGTTLSEVNGRGKNLGKCGGSGDNLSKCECLVGGIFPAW
jgi:hypothetical protein